MYYVYIYLNDEGVPYYVGKGCKYRRKHYASDRVCKEHPAPSDPTKVIMVQENMTEAAAFALEIKLIAEHKRECDGGTLINKCLGGPGTRGFKHNPNRPSPMKGRKHTKASKKKMSQAKLGNSCRATRTYLLTKPDGSEVLVNNLAEYCRTHNLNRKALTNILCGRSKTHKGYKIKRIEVES